MSSQSENAMTNEQAENYTQPYPVTPYWVKEVEDASSENTTSAEHNTPQGEN